MLVSRSGLPARSISRITFMPRVRWLSRPPSITVPSGSGALPGSTDPGQARRERIVVPLEASAQVGRQQVDGIGGGTCREVVVDEVALKLGARPRSLADGEGRNIQRRGRRPRREVQGRRRGLFVLADHMGHLVLRAGQHSGHQEVATPAPHARQRVGARPRRVGGTARRPELNVDRAGAARRRAVEGDQGIQRRGDDRAFTGHPRPHPVGLDERRHLRAVESVLDPDSDGAGAFVHGGPGEGAVEAVVASHSESVVPPRALRLTAPPALGSTGDAELEDRGRSAVRGCRRPDGPFPDEPGGRRARLQRNRAAAGLRGGRRRVEERGDGGGHHQCGTLLFHSTSPRYICSEPLRPSHP